MLRTSPLSKKLRENPPKNLSNIGKTLFSNIVKNFLINGTVNHKIMANKKMKKHTRKEFFQIYLNMLVEGDITILKETPNYILGQLRWAEEPEYPEEIRWNCKKSDIPSPLCFEIVSFISSENLVEIDMIKLSRRKLYKAFCEYHITNISFKEFESAFEELLDIEFIRFENGEEIDSFYVHE